MSTCSRNIFGPYKAYSVLNHNTLLHKLYSFSIRGNMNLWFKSYLSNNSKFVSITQMEHRNFIQYRYISSFRNILHAVPQVSILDSYLFLLYINDVPLNIQGVKLVFFVEDRNTLVDKNKNALQQKILCYERIRDMVSKK
jgi:hypothetical protein